MPGSSSWMPCAPQGVKWFDDSGNSLLTFLFNLTVSSSTIQKPVTVLSFPRFAFHLCIAANCDWPLLYCVIILCVWYDIFNCNWVGTRWQQYSTHWHTNSTQNNTIDTKQHTKQHNSLIRNSAGRAPSLRGIPWHLPYNWGKSTEKPQSG